jgi:hypothetical protein
MDDRKKESGLTLVECVIAIIIGTILLVGFLQVCTTSALNLKNLRFRVNAVNIAQAELEDIISLGSEGIDEDDYTPFLSTPVVIDEGPTDLHGDDIIGDMRTYVREVTVAPLKGKKIWVTVTWNFMGSSRSELLQTVIYSPN